MKRLSLVLTLVCLAFGTLLAQRTITGKVTDQRGEPLIGASILVKGTSSGTVTDVDGSYSLDVPEGTQTLIFSYTGFSTREVTTGASSVIDVTLEEGITLSEAVVTALGIEREKKALGYAVQQVDGDQLNQVGDQNVVGALSGKVAGVQIVNSSGASLGGGARIRIRGATALVGGGSPLFVVDGTPISDANFSGDDSGIDFGNLAQDINPNDIESVTVLKGPAAAALYGNRGANGVVMITTKKGVRRKGIGVTYNGSVTGDRVYVLPEYQNEYAGGYNQNFIPKVDPVDGQTYNTLNYAADESWGPKMDGRLYRPWWSWYPGEDYGKQIPLSPQPDNVRNFFETGLTWNNNIALSGGTEKSTFRLSYTNINQSGVIPNSELKRNNISINGSTALSDRLTVGANVNFSTVNGSGRPNYGYSPVAGNVVQSFNQWFQRQLDMDRLRDYKNPDGTFRSWNIRDITDLRPLYWDSPYFTVFENVATDSRDRYFGNVSLAYQVMDGLSVTGFLRRDAYTQRIENRIATGGLEQDFYGENVYNGSENNYEVVAQYNKAFGNISLDANLGGNIRDNYYHRNSVSTNGGLKAPNLFNTDASVDRPTTTSFRSRKIVRSVYGGANVGFNSMLYLGFTLRNDWSSSLPAENNSYLYPSVQGSFVFSELMKNSNFLSFGKIRGSFAQVGSDVADFARDFNPYQKDFSYGFGTPYGSTPTFELPNQLPNEDLRPALASSYEAGVELRFLRDRLGLDFTVYRTDFEDQILDITVPGSSGFSTAIINAGNIRSEGLELALNATPVQTRNFNWDITFNIAKNNSKVIELAEGLDNRQLDAWSRWTPTVNAPVGGTWGMLRGNGYTYIDGQPVITESGAYRITPNKDLGSVLPDWTGGVRNSIDWKGLTLTAFVEFQVGGNFHSTTRQFTDYSGLSVATVGNNDKGMPIRDPVANGGGVRVDGVLEDGTPHTVYVPAISYFGGLFSLHEAWVYDASYVKLRELSLGYNFPSNLLNKTPLQSLRLSVIARNLWLIHSNVDGIDPSEILNGSNQYTFHEGGQLPGVRSIGLNLNIGF